LRITGALRVLAPGGLKVTPGNPGCPGYRQASPILIDSDAVWTGMTDRRFTGLVITSAVVLGLSWTLFAYVSSALGFDLEVFAIFSAVTLVLAGGDIAIWFLLIRRRSRLFAVRDRGEI
jgi:hypothetical protein